MMQYCSTEYKPKPESMETQTLLEFYFVAATQNIVKIRVVSSCCMSCVILWNALL